MNREDFEFDRLRLYFGCDYVMKNGIIIRQPTIGEILDCGERKFFTSINTFISNPTSYRLPLWEVGIDWNKISDFDLFCMLYQTIDSGVSQLIFPDTDFSEFKLYGKTVDGQEQEKPEVVLYNGIMEIDSDCYLEFSQYLRIMFGIFPKTEHAKGRATKEALMDEERMKLDNMKKLGTDKYTSTLLPLISSCINHPGFKYNLQELKDIGICQFMDAVERLQVYESTTALLKGMYSGFCDTSKINKNEFNFMRDLSVREPPKIPEADKTKIDNKK